MEMREIQAVEKVAGEGRANAYLQAGWVLLNTATERDGESTYFVYSLGWPNDLPPQVPKDI